LHPDGALGRDFFAPLFFGFVPDAGFGESGFITHHQVVDKAHKDGLGGFGGDAAGPGFFLVEFVFELIVDFFKIPAAAVEQGDEARGKFHVIGQV
jgi:hypothetical protein